MKLFKKVKKWFKKSQSTCVEDIKDKIYVLDVTKSQLESLSKGYVPVALKEEIKTTLKTISIYEGE